MFFFFCSHFVVKCWIDGWFQLPCCHCLKSSIARSKRMFRALCFCAGLWWLSAFKYKSVWVGLRYTNFNRDSGIHISKAWDPAISALQRLRARGQHSTNAPALAMPGVDQCTWCEGKPILIGKQAANSAIKKRATSDNKDEYSLYKQSVFPNCTHSSEEGHRASRWPKA